jgi:hypothetical protein
MTSPDVSNASPCKGCPDSLPPGYTKPDDAPLDWVPTGLPEGLPECVSKADLVDTPGTIHSESLGLYVGGTPEEHLCTIFLTIPKEYTRVDMTHSGDILYKKGPDDWEPPGPIDGYECDGENQWLFHPLWKSCKWRHYGVAIKQKCQCIDVIARCGISSCWVKSSECSECKARASIKSQRIPQKKTIQSLRFPDLPHNSK